MAIETFDPDISADENLVQIAALPPTDNAVIIGNGSAWTAESGSPLRASLGLAIGSDVMAYDADLADWAGVNPSSYLTTAAAALAYQPLDADLTSWAGVTRASGFDTFAATPTSANLRALLTDESGSGALLFAGGALGTPASGVLTNCTGLPNASVVGLGTAALVADNTLAHLAGTETFTGRKLFSGSGNTIVFNRGASPEYTIEIQDNGTIRSYLGGNVTNLFSVKNSGGTDMLAITATTASVYGDPVMTRGAAETVTGVKTFSSGATVLSKASGLNAVYMTSNNGGGNYGSTIIFQDGATTSANIASVASGELRIGILGSEKVFVRSASVELKGQFTNLDTYFIGTASGANVVVDSNGLFQRFTSSEKYKRDIEPISDEWVDRTLAAADESLIWYASKCANDNPDWHWPGMSAERLVKGAPHLVQYRTDGETPEPEGVDYARFVVPLIRKIMMLERRLAALEASQ